jgi:tRNA(Arg) A34 adenosine deaminase TadA
MSNPSNPDTFMRHALKLASENMRTQQGGPFGAVIVRNNEIIAEGWNQVTSTNDPTAHAEVVAIRQACAKLGSFNLPDCDIYASCEPCPMCLGAIYWTRLRRLYYANTRSQAAEIGFDDELIYREIGVAPESRSITGIRLSTPGSHLPFAQWVAMPDKTLY